MRGGKAERKTRKEGQRRPQSLQVNSLLALICRSSFQDQPPFRVPMFICRGNVLVSAHTEIGPECP